MKYSELVQYDPIESVIKINDAGMSDRAQQLLNTYVFSDDIVTKLKDLVFPQLQLNDPTDHKGILIVGNYGTGKSHLMSVISVLAEHAEMLDGVKHPVVKEAAKSIAGQFKIVRFEIGSTEMTLRDIILQNIERNLRSWDIDFKFPKATEVSENKSTISEMMAAFQQKFPDKGLLIICDELLDYLKGRNQQELTLDLGFLREIGEVCKDLRFRFIGGVQEAIFESDTFKFVAQSLMRVKDRFHQVRIQRTDISFVVAHRLLNKTEQQKKTIREYLQKYTSFYEGLTERLDEFVELFPVHPEYIRTFERLPIIEQRGVLQVLSLSFERMQDDDLPSDHPGLLALDSFWGYLNDDPAHRTNDDIRLTLDSTDTLLDKIETGFPKNKRQYQPLATKIVKGLSVNRLTTSDIHLPIGMTNEEIRDQMCVFHPLAGQMGGNESEDLLTIIDVTLKEIRTCVSGQFLSHNDDNHQYYLDLKKTEDFDALVEKRVPSLSDDDKDNAYFSVLRQILEITTDSKFTGFRIWEEAIPWKEKNVTKLGWLFFGVPSERSTAQPPRDFYLYFPQIIKAPSYKDEARSDEVFLKLDASDDEFHKALGLFAAALSLQHNSTGAKKEQYARKAEIHFKALCRWMSEHFLSKIKITYRGSTKSLSQCLAGENAAGKTAREQLYLATSKLLNEHFSSICGDYPGFSKQITFGDNGNVKQVVGDSLRMLAGTTTQSGVAVLDGLGLMDGERITAEQSPYADYILAELNKKGHGQVLNANELVQTIDGIPYFKTPTFRLEEELLIVVISTLVYAGEVVLSIPGKEFTATNLRELSQIPLDDLRYFKHVKKPKDWNIPALKALFELLSLSPGLATQVTQNDPSAVTQLIAAISAQVEKLVMMKQQFAGGIPFWNTVLLRPEEIRTYVETMGQAKDFLESLQGYNSPGKLKNLSATVEDIQSCKKKLENLRSLESLKAFADELSTYTRYLSQAESILPEEHEWRAQSKCAKDALLQAIQKPENREDAAFRTQTLQKLRELKQSFIKHYLAIYQHSRLTIEQDRRKQKILSDSRFQQLNALSAISTMPVSQLRQIQDTFGELKTGQNLTAADLEETPHIDGFYPAMESQGGVSAEQRLNNLENDIDKTHANWIQALLHEFEDPTAQENVKLLPTASQTLIRQFCQEKEIPEATIDEFVKAVQQALSDLSKVVLNQKKLTEILFPDGSATTVEDIRSRFESYLDSITQGKDRSKVRLVIEGGE